MASAQNKQTKPQDSASLWDSDLFGTAEAPPAASGGYTAKDIEVLEGLEPVRRRPGMYIGGVDERALHHLFAEVLDNSMDEAVAGFADRIEVEFESDGTLRVTDNGRGMPVEPHPIADSIAKPSREGRRHRSSRKSARPTIAAAPPCASILMSRFSARALR